MPDERATPKPAPTAAASWEGSSLPRAIVGLLDVPMALAQIADELGVTDARVLWYLSKLEATGRVEEHDGRWTRTDRGVEYAQTPQPDNPDHTILPGRTVYDYQQAYADAAAGMFGTTFVQGKGEHGGRVPHERAVEFQERLLSLIAEYFAPDQVDRSATPKYGFHWVLTPTDLHPLGE